jgi:hypothetical protein
MFKSLLKKIKMKNINNKVRIPFRLEIQNLKAAKLLLVEEKVK